MLLHVPPLSLLCVQLLSQSPDQLHRVFGKLKLNLLYPLLPPDTSVTQLDPCLWASLIQIYHHVPATLITYPIHLEHVQLPLLQRIPQTSHFSLITLLELPGFAHLTDNLLYHAYHLHSLTALDVSGTTVSSNAVKLLAGTLMAPHASNGPWLLRILRLYNCKNIDNTIFPFLHKFPLLCVLDLRGTQCIPRPTSLPSDWSPSNSENLGLFFPSSLSQAVDSLVHSAPQSLWSSRTVFRLLIDVVDAQSADSSNNHNSEGSSQLDTISANLFYGNLEENAKHSAAAYYRDARNHNELVSFADGVLRPNISKQLMLYRRPPPWGTPQGDVSSTRESTRRLVRKGQEIVAIKGGKAQLAALEKLQEEAVRRRQMTNNITIPTSTTSQSSGQKRNPFARRV